MSNRSLNNAASLNHCIEISEPGCPSVLKSAARERPVVGSKEILIHVAAAGVNRPDVLQRRGVYVPPPGVSDIPGLEVAGRVVAVGSNVTEFEIGDEVCALTPGGGYSEYCVTPEAQALSVPRNINLVEAAALPETLFTVWFNIFMQGQLRAGQSLLVHGGTSGIGTAAIQLAKAFGAKVLATAGSDFKCHTCQRLGADLAVNYKLRRFEEELMDFTGGSGVDMVLDYIGGDYVERNLSVLKHGGRLVSLYFLQGSRVNVDLMPVLQRNLTITGSLMRPQPVTTKKQIRDHLREYVWPKIESEQIRANVFRIFPLEAANKAHELMESNKHIGKIVLVNNSYQ